MKLWRKIPASLSARLILSHVAVAVLGLALALAISQFTFRRYLVQSELTTLQHRGQEIARVMQGYFTGGLYGSTAAYLIRVLQGTLKDRVYVVDDTGQILLATSNGKGVPAAPFPIGVLRQVLIRGHAFQGTLRDPAGHLVAAAGVPVPVGNTIAGGVFLESPVSASNAKANSLTGILLAGEAIAVILAGILAYMLSRHLSSPLESLRRTVARMGEGDPSARAQLDGPLEVSTLAQEFNAMADRLEAQMILLTREAEARETLLGHVAHDLRTPLTSIRGFLEALRDGVVSGAQAERAVEVAWEETLRLQRLVDRLLTVTRIRSGGGERRPVDLSRWVADTLERMEPLARERGQTFTWEKAAQGQVLGVEDYLVEALMNVVDNALKWTKPGGTITVTTARHLQDGLPVLTVTVEDEGPGIAKELLPHVLERFVTGNPARGQSTGLGLAIVDDVMRQHGGRVEVSNRPQGGARVVLTLPEYIAPRSDKPQES